MQLISKKATQLLLLSLLMVLSIDAFSQEVILGDENVPYQIKETPNRQTTIRKTSGTTAINLPFFDDFSYNALTPDTNLWDLGLVQLSAPGISTSKGIKPPSKGVATFDGANAIGQKYDTNDLIMGTTDTLTSREIDLSSFLVADSLYLSFQVEPGGNGDKPEFVDSLRLYFMASGGEGWKKVWAVGGDSLPQTRFHQVNILVDTTLFLHPQFRFKFEGWGSLNGELDQWHLDYVYMDANRTAGDTIFNDQSIINILNPLFGGYSRMHREEYLNRVYGAKMGIQFANANNSTQSRSASVQMVDGFGNLSLTGTTSDSKSNISIPLLAHSVDSLGPLTDQILMDSALLRLNFALGGTDSRPQNDSFSFDFKIDSVLAFDDGVSDIGYGLTSPRAFCQEFKVSRPDTLTGVWIHFAPTIYYNGVTGQVTCLENKVFKLTVWSHLFPDSILQQRTGAKVQYGSELNHFERYTFFEDVPVDSTFWVGIEQSDEMPIGIGFDRNFVNDIKVYYENNSGQFIGTNQGGTLMLRCEFGNKEGGAIGVEDPISLVPYTFTVYPNPTQGEIDFRISGPEQIQEGRVIISGLDGKVIAEKSLGQQSSGDFQMPDSMPAGMYLLTLEAQSYSGKPVFAQQKLMIAR